MKDKEFNEIVGTLGDLVLNIIGNHQLQSASLVGMSEGMADVIRGMDKDDPARRMYIGHYTALKHMIDLRIKEVKQYMEALENTGLNIGLLDMDFLEERAKEIMKKSKSFAINSKPEKVKETINKLMDGLKNVKVEDEKD